MLGPQAWIKYIDQRICIKQMNQMHASKLGSDNESYTWIRCLDQIYFSSAKRNKDKKFHNLTYCDFSYHIRTSVLCSFVTHSIRPTEMKIYTDIAIETLLKCLSLPAMVKQSHIRFQISHMRTDFASFAAFWTVMALRREISFHTSALKLEMKFVWR